MAADTNVVCKEICRVSRNKNAVSNFNIECIQDKNSCNVVLVSNRSRHIYIIRNLSVKMVINFDSDIVDICFDKKHNMLYVAATSGQLYTVPIIGGDICKAHPAMCNASNQDIFTDLLQPVASQSLADGDTYEHVKHMTCKDSVLSMIGIQRVLTVDDSVIILATTQQGWMIQVYNRETMETGHGNCKMTMSHLEHQHHINNNSNNNSNSSLDSPHICMCLLAGSATANLYDKTKRCCVLEPTFFQQLFGEDAQLLQSPVLLVSMSDGAVFTMPLKCTSRKHELQLVCHLKEPVVDIITFRDNTVASAGTCMVIVGSRGKIISVTEGYNSSVRFAECVIAGQVGCLTVHHQHLVYSTYRQLCYIPLSDLTEIHCSGQTIQGAAWEVHGVVAVSSLCTFTCNSVAGELLVLTTRGCIMHVTARAKSMVGHPVTTHRIKDLLTNIGFLGDQRDAIQKTVKHQSATLEQLSLINCMAAQDSERLLLGNMDVIKRDSSTSNRPFTVAVSFKKHWTGMGHACSLVVTLSPAARLNLIAGWRFVVTVSSSGSSISKSVCMHSSFLEIVFNIPDSLLLQLPLDVICSLVYHVTADTTCQAPGRTVSVVVHHCRFDVIDVCVLADAIEVSLDVTPKCCQTNYEELLNCSGDTDESKLNCFRQYTTSVDICQKETELTETVVLKKLLGRLNESISTSCQLHRLPFGHSVILSIHFDANHYTVTIKTRDVCTLVLMRTTITERIEQWFPHQHIMGLSLEITAIRKLLQELQCLDTDLRFIGDPERKESVSELEKMLVDIYLKLQHVLL